MAKETAKGFNLLVPFSIKADASDDGETLQVEGIANFCGDLSDDKCIEVDLAGEVVVPTGMDISVYKSNPQILWQHDREASIGVCDKITKKKDGIYIEATIHKGAMSDQDWYRVKTGLVTRFSIGFRCKGGEYKEINGRSVYFITKSLLLEISIVTIPASSSSSFHVVKSFTEEDGGEGLYSGDIFSDTEDTQEEKNITIKETKRMDTIKLKLKDFLSEDQVAELKSKGLEAALEKEEEVDFKTYVDSAIKSAVAAAVLSLKEEIVKELSTTEEETEEKSEGSTEETEESTEESTEKSEEEVAEEEEKAADAEVVKNLTDTIAQLKALIEETK